MATKRCPNCENEFDEHRALCPQCGTGDYNPAAIGLAVVLIGVLFFMVAVVEPWMWILTAFLIPVILYVVLAIFD